MFQSHIDNSILSKEYINHPVFEEIKYMMDFYESVSYTCYFFLSIWYIIYKELCFRYI